MYASFWLLGLSPAPTTAIKTLLSLSWRNFSNEMSSIRFVFKPPLSYWSTSGTVNTTCVLWTVHWFVQDRHICDVFLCLCLENETKKHCFFQMSYFVPPIHMWAIETAWLIKTGRVKTEAQNTMRLLLRATVTNQAGYDTGWLRICILNSSPPPRLQSSASQSPLPPLLERHVNKEKT